MGFTTTDLAAIETAIATGERRVQFADKTVEYRDVGELLKARDVIKRELDTVAAGGSSDAQRRYSRVIFSRGRE